jgi:predicted dinucleotide-binding enzyme
VNVGIIGSGRIGGNIGSQLARRGHEVLFSFSRNAASLRAVSERAGEGARVGSPADAVEFGDAVVLSVPWAAVDEALEQAGSLEGRIVVDTTNQFGKDGLEELDRPAIAVNQERMPGARLVRAFNTLTAGYQKSVGDGEVGEAIAMFYASEDDRAGEVAETLISDCNFVPVRLRGREAISLMEAPRRDGAVYGEAYDPDSARAIADAAREDLDRARTLAVERRL